jgi:hypothetical protein
MLDLQDYSGNSYHSVSVGTQNPTFNGEWADFSSSLSNYVLFPSTFRTAYSGLTSYSITAWFALSSVSNQRVSSNPV